MTDIGKRIGEARKRLGLTQQQLSIQSGVDYNTLRKVETGGVKNPSSDFLKKIGAALGEDISLLVEGEKPKVQGADILPFHQLTADRFEDLIYSIVLAENKVYLPPELYAAKGDKKRDIIAKRWEKGAESKGYTLFQAKRHKKITVDTLKEELDGIKKHFFDNLNPSTVIDAICFCISSNASPKLQDEIKDYATTIGLPKPSFWHARVLNAYCEKNSSIIAQYFGGNIENAINMLKEQEDLQKKANKNIEKALELQKETIESVHTMGLGLLNSSNDQDMEKAKRLIKTGEYLKARDILLAMKKGVELSGNNDKKKNLLNNLGICYINSTQIQEGIDCFIEALDIDPSFSKPKQNLVAAYINYPQYTNYDLAREYAKDAYVNEKNNLELLGNYLYALCLSRKYDTLRELLASEDALEKAPKNELISIAIGLFYLGTGDFVLAQEHMNKSVGFFPESGNLYNMLGEATMAIAEEAGFEIRHLQTVAIYNRPDLLDAAHSYFKKAYSLLPGNHPLVDTIKFNILVCEALLSKLGIHKSSTNELDISSLSEPLRKQLEKIHFARFLEEERKYEDAFGLFKKTYEENTPPLSYDEIKNVAIKFFHYGSPEHTIKILAWIEDQAQINQNDVEYWSYKSMSYALLGDKADAISTLNDAKEVFKDDPEKFPIILSHYAALAIRYPDHSEAGRMIENIQKLDQLQPEKHIMTPIPAVNMEDGTLTPEIKEVFAKLHDDMASKKQMFLNTPLPIYTLQRLFGRSFPEVIDMVRNSFDFEFVLPYNGVDAVFQKRRQELFDSNEKFVADYSVLLNLARCGHLGIFKSLGKKVLVSQLLLSQVQEDLVRHEDKALRDVWEFLRKGDVTIIPRQSNFADRKIDPEIAEFFEDWLVQEIEYCAQENLVFLSDDLRLLGYVNGDQIGGKSINSFIFFQRSLEQKKIDKKQYSMILAEYADSLYYFISFDGEDLLNIVLDDENRMRNNTSVWIQPKLYGQMKISRRVFHLLHQVHLPGSIVQTFIHVAGDFLVRLFKLGVLDETKLGWALFLTNYFSDFISVEEIKKSPFGLHDKTIDDVIGFIVRVWAILVKSLGVHMKDKIFETSEEIKHDVMRAQIQEFLKNQNK